MLHKSIISVGNRMKYEQSEKTMLPPFELNKPRYGQDTFWGRFRHFIDIIDPRTLFTTQAQLEHSIRILEEFKRGSKDYTDEELWRAQKIKQAIIHPDTGEKILMPFRMSGYVPFGTPVTVGLVLPTPTLFQTIFFQWLNQSHNACVNYANRNASQVTSTSTFIQGYLGATTVAVGIAVGLTQIIKRAESLPPASRLVIQRFFPFPAVSAASVANVVLMRRHELDSGIDVVDEQGVVIGRSRVAAAKALKEMAVTRAFLPAPILLIPPIVLLQLEKTKWLKSNPRWHLPINAFLVLMTFGLALPLTISIFPQMSQIPRESLEDEFQSYQHKYLYYNRGL